MKVKTMINDYLVELYSKYRPSDKLTKVGEDFIVDPRQTGRLLRDVFLDIIFDKKFIPISPGLRNVDPDIGHIEFNELFFFFNLGLNQDIRRSIKVSGIVNSKISVEDLVDLIIKEHLRDNNSTRIGNQFRNFLLSYIEDNDSSKMRDSGQMFKTFVSELQGGSSKKRVPTEKSGNWVVAIEKPGLGKSEYDISPDVDEVYPLFKKFGIKKGDIFNQGYDDLSVELEDWNSGDIRELVDYLNNNLPEASDSYKTDYGMPSTSHNAVGMLYPEGDEFFEEEPLKSIY